VSISDGPGSASGRLLVGRDREVRELHRALESALAGRGQLCLLVGEPGIGKTRLADEAAAAAHARGVPVLWGRCWEAGGAPAYFPWLEPLAELARGVDDAALEECVGAAGALVIELLPELRRRLPGLPALAAPEPGEARFRLWRAVASLIRRASSGGLVLILEDLHAADESSLSLLLFLARELRAMRALVVCTYRDVEARLTPAVGELLARVAREGVLLPLGRLDRGAASDLLRQRVGGDPTALEGRIFENTQGNPLFIEEMARLLEDRGPEAIAAGEVPDGVREAIRQRLARLPAEARALLDLAAVAGDELDAGLLAEAAGAGRDRVAAALHEATRVGVLVERGGRRRFYHALVREVLYRGLDQEQRRTLHGAVAAALGRRTAGQANQPLAELAHHALEGPRADVGRAVDFAIQAAGRALATLAYEEATATLTRAVTAVEEAGNPTPLRARALLALAEARIRKGEGEAGKTLCREVASLARALGDHQLLAQAALTYGMVFRYAVVDPVLVGMLEEALEALPAGDSPLRARLLGRLAGALTPAPQNAEPVRIAGEAIATARRLGDPQTLLATLYAALSALMDVVHARERLALNLEVEQLAIRLGERDRLLRTLARLVTDHMELGQMAAADARIEEFAALVEELHATWYRWRVPLCRSARAMMQGRFAEAEGHVAEAERLARLSGDVQAERCLVMHKEGFLRARERHAEMVAHDAGEVRRMRAELSHAMFQQSIASAMVYGRIEDAERARQYVERLGPEVHLPADNLFAMSYTVDAVALAGTPEQVEALYRAVAPVANRDVMMGMSMMCWEGPGSRLLGILTARLGRFDEAATHFEAALARCRELEARPFLARIEYEYGRSLLARGRPQDLAQARGLLASARASAEALGMTGLVQLVDRRLVASGAPAPAPVTSPQLPFSMLAEGEYWTISHRGSTVRLKDSLGLQYLARLVGEPGKEIHALDLVGGRRGGEAEPIDVGDAGEALDDEARDSYRGRLEDLREELAEAESFGDATRAARARAEIEFLGAELGRAVGLGGRARRTGSAAERARIAVQRRIKNAIGRIGEAAPGLAEYLSRSVKTGNFCVFRPG
jgi:tetratricopeptide (TPR) repeat protein